MDKQDIFTIRSEGDWYVDGRRNKWDKKRYTLEEAQSMAYSLKNCYDCTNCYYLKDSNNTIGSFFGKELIGCERCFNSKRLYNCTDCLSCRNSISLKNCVNVKYGYGVENLTLNSKEKIDVKKYLKMKDKS